MNKAEANPTTPPGSTSGLSSRLLWALLGIVFRLRGWRIVGGAPDLRKYVLIGAPHTSNWDFVFFAGTMQQLGIRASFMGKHTLFRWPLRRFMLDMGGMPVDRSKPGGYTRSVIRTFALAQDMALVIAPEGTRNSSGEWRSGFYHIACGAGVAIVPAWVDHARKLGGIGEPIWPTGDYAVDSAVLLAFYRSVMPDCSRFAASEPGSPVLDI